MRLAILLGIGLALLTLPQALSAQTCNGWEGRFYNNTDFTGSPSFGTCSQVIDFNWGVSAPATGVNADNFSSRWTSIQSFPTAGIYQFTATVDGGVRLFVNGTPLINSMTQGQRMLTAPYEVTSAGATAFITLEMASWEGTAQLKLEWSLTSGGLDPSVPLITAPTIAEGTPAATNLSVMGGGTSWYIEYFANTSLEGEPAAQDSAPADGINRNYVGAPPAEGMDMDNWSARWTRPVDFPEGTYTFTLRADDSARVLIDDMEILNQPQFQDGQDVLIAVQIPAGQHRIVVEYTELAGDANLFLSWDPPIGTTLFLDGCNGETAGINGSAPPCPDRLMEFEEALQGTGIAMPVSVRAGPLRFRPAPATSAEPIEMLHEGEQYTAVGRSADNVWVQLIVEDETGWSMSEFLTLTGDINTLAVTDGSAVIGTSANTAIQVLPNAATPTPAEATTQVVPESAPPDAPASATGVRAQALGNLRLRAAPDLNAERLGGIEWGSVVDVIGRSPDGRWLQVQLGTSVGWSAQEWYQIIEGDIERVPIVQ